MQFAAFIVVTALSSIVSVNAMLCPLSTQCPPDPITSSTTITTKTIMASSTIMKSMPTGIVAPPDVPVGSGGDPFVTYLDPNGSWITQRVNNPTPLLNGNYVVTAIGNINICSGNWGFLYLVTSANDYPLCKGNFGQYNTGDPTNGARLGYSGLQYGTCPKSVYHRDVGGQAWGNETYNNCWTGYWNWGQPNDGTSGTSTFPNGIKVGYCCFN